MIAVDTNVVLRFVTNDDQAQADRATEVFEGGSVLVTRTVLLETEWVLRTSHYRFGRGRIASILRKLLGLPGLIVDDPPAVARALDWYEGGLDFADALHLASSAAAAEFVTFDRKLARRAARLGAKPPVRTLG